MTSPFRLRSHDQNEQTVPTPSAFLTRIFRTLSAISSQSIATGPQQPAEKTSKAYDGAGATSPSSSILPDTARPLLTTLHLLCPVHLLPALDLLDRGMVQRVTHRSKGPATNSAHDLHHQSDYTTYYVLSNRSAHLIAPNQSTTTPASRSPYPFHSRTSLAPGAADAAGSRSAEAKSYTVHLRAWNCDCPAFTYSAYAATDKGTSVSDETLDQVQELLAKADAKEEQPRGHTRQQLHTGDESEPSSLEGGILFGGLVHALREHRAAKTGNDAKKSEGLSMPPLCKHIIACCLADSCPAFFVAVEKALDVEEEDDSRVGDLQIRRSMQAHTKTPAGRGAWEMIAEDMETMAGAAALGGLW